MFWIFLVLNVGTVRILFCLDPDPYRFCLDPYKMTRIPNTSWNCEVTLQKEVRIGKITLPGDC